MSAESLAAKVDATPGGVELFADKITAIVIRFRREMKERATDKETESYVRAFIESSAFEKQTMAILHHMLNAESHGPPQTNLETEEAREEAAQATEAKVADAFERGVKVERTLAVEQFRQAGVAIEVYREPFSEKEITAAPLYAALAYNAYNAGWKSREQYERESREEVSRRETETE